jgi:glycerophosphoryl diester phosphodiesterase
MLIEAIVKDDLEVFTYGIANNQPKNRQLQRTAKVTGVFVDGSLTLLQQ